MCNRPKYKLGNILLFNPTISLFSATDPLRQLVNLWTDCPFKALIPTSQSNDNSITYHHWRSYSKTLSAPIADAVKEYTSEYFYDEPRTEKSISLGDFNTLINSYAVSMYGEKWTRLYEALNLDYNPTHNYDITESETTDSDGNVSTDNTQNRNESSGVYAYNNTTSTPSDTATATTTDTGSSETNSTVTRQLTRSGIDGGVIPADLLAKELEIRKTIFLGIVMDDLDNLFTERIYEGDDFNKCW